MSNQKIGSYEIIEQIGAGGMATVYKAYQPKLDRYVAIKIMHPMLAQQDNSFLTRFEREARIVARLDHPNIVPVYDYDEYEGKPYLVMKILEGQTLKDVMKDHTLPLESIRSMMLKIADALTYAHKQGILHRDIKPSNIIIDQFGIPYLTDFGLARITKQGESTMSADTMLGTPQYISPEQAQGLPDLDAHTDVYSLGIILYELVAGRVPFVGDVPYAIIHKHIYAAPPMPSELNPEVPTSLDEVLLRALAKDPSDRYDTPSQLMQAFEQAIQVSGLQELSEDRVHQAQELGAVITPITPGGSKYVSIPSPVATEFTSTPVNDIVQQVGERFRVAFNDVKQELYDRGIINQVAGTVQKVASEIQTSIANSSSTAGKSSAEAFGTANKSSKVKITRSKKVVKLIDSDWGTDEESIRRRVKQRMGQRRGLFVHVLIYTIVIAAIATAQPYIQDGLAMVFNDPGFIEEVGADYLQPLAHLNILALVALTWGSGVIAHALSIFYNAGKRQENKRRAMQDEFVAFYGEDWRDKVDTNDYRKIRRRIEDRYKRRVGFISHFISFIMMSAAAFIVWPPIYQTLLEAPTTDIDPGVLATQDTAPAFFMLFLAVTVFLHAIGLAVSHTFGQDAHERAFKTEMEREREFSRISSAYPARPSNEKLKNEVFEDEKAKNTLSSILPTEDLQESHTPRVRLTEDGEFTNSFIEELEDDQRQQQA